MTCGFPGLHPLWLQDLLSRAGRWLLTGGCADRHSAGRLPRSFLLASIALYRRSVPSCGSGGRIAGPQRSPPADRRPQPVNLVRQSAFDRKERRLRACRLPPTRSVREDIPASRHRWSRSANLVTVPAPSHEMRYPGQTDSPVEHRHSALFSMSGVSTVRNPV